MLIRRIAQSLSAAALLAAVLGGLVGANATVRAQVVPVKIASFQVTTVDGRSIGSQPLMAGAAYKVSFTLEIAAGIKDRATLKTELSRTGDRYWSMSGNYSGIDVKTWQPGQSQITFDTVEGTLKMELQGTVPGDFVVSEGLSGEELHIATPLSLLEVSLPGGRVLEDKSQEVIDDAIETYRLALEKRQQLLENTGADGRYVGLVEAMIAGSQEMADRGYAASATEMLEAVPQSGWIEPQGSSIYQWIIIGVLAVIVVIMLLSFFRSRSEGSFAKRRVDDQAKRLEILSSRARGIGDTKLSDEIDRVKKDLEEISGR